eukprot:PhM_4_TR7842/c0_g1_i1/m.62816/K10390/TUBD; tubulin delta
MLPGVITLQVGQCGNQLGCDFFDAIARVASSTSNDLFSHPKTTQPLRTEIETFQQNVTSMFFRETAESSLPLARALLIDMEPKVVEHALHDAKHNRKTFQYGSFRESCLVQQDGSANNWAYGYNAQGPSCYDGFVQKMRGLLEELDACQGISLIHSLAGGTGSGAGCFLTLMLEEEFGDVVASSSMMNTVVMPFEKGEVTVQAYNMVLSIASLSERSDAICVLSNDEVTQLCMKNSASLRRNVSSSNSSSIVRPGEVHYDDINYVMAARLASVMLPTSSCFKLSSTPDSNGDDTDIVIPEPRMKLLQKQTNNTKQNRETSCSSITPFSDFIYDITGNRTFKFFEIRSSPFVSSQARNSEYAPTLWKSVIDDVSFHVRPTSAKFSLSFLRGVGAHSDGIEEMLRDRSRRRQQQSSLFMSSVPMHPSFPIFSSSAFSGARTTGEMIEAVATKASGMLSSGAYLHHYENNGVCRDDLQRAIITCYDVARSYQNS